MRNGFLFIKTTTSIFWGSDKFYQVLYTSVLESTKFVFFHCSLLFIFIPKLIILGLKNEQKATVNTLVYYISSLEFKFGGFLKCIT